MDIVTDIPEGGKRINIEGKKGESLFHHPVIWVIEKDFNRIKEQNERNNELMRRADEERLLAIVSALLMEEALDLLLGAYILKYSTLQRQRDFTLFLKIELARSLCVIPKHIIDAAALINSVRNKFAHQIELDSFGSLDVGTRANLKEKSKLFYPDDEPDRKTAKELFTKVVFGVITALAFYAPHLRDAREYIFSEAFGKELDRLLKGKQK
jgi:hypothetical protein